VIHGSVTRSRRAAINASTVFAVTLAILAGLIFAYVFKVFVLDRKKEAAPQPAPEKYRLTLAAINMSDKVLVQPGMTKTVTVSKERYDEVLKEYGLDPKGYGKVLADGRRNALLRDAQPLGRTTIKSIRAEEPMFEDQFEPLNYPVSLKELMKPGKQAVMIEVPGKTTMVQVDDVVDVQCTISNEAPVFGPAGSSATAVLARGVRVISRFHTTRTAAAPPTTPEWPYTLEVEPWQGAIIELARNVGGQFKLSVSGTVKNLDGSEIKAGSTSPSDGTQYEKASEIVAANFANTGRVTVNDLALLFGVENPPPEYVHRLERLAGNVQQPTIEYRGLKPPPPEPKDTKSPTKPASNGNGNGNGAKSDEKTKPASGPTSSSDRPSGYSYSSAMTSRGNMGFQAPVDPNACQHCGKKK
jgi:Flp pilus assembly protein CpaB